MEWQYIYTEVVRGREKKMYSESRNRRVDPLNERATPLWLNTLKALRKMECVYFFFFYVLASSSQSSKPFHISFVHDLKQSLLQFDLFFFVCVAIRNRRYPFLDQFFTFWTSENRICNCYNYHVTSCNMWKLANYNLHAKLRNFAVSFCSRYVVGNLRGLKHPSNRQQQKMSFQNFVLSLDIFMSKLDGDFSVFKRFVVISTQVILIMTKIMP